VKIDDIDHLVRQDGDCLVWRHGCSNGHPAMKHQGKNVLVRRALWAGLNGPIPAGKIIRCTCDTDRCVNPEHLECTTYQRLGKQLGALGLMSGPIRSAAIAKAKRSGKQAKITEADVNRIRNSSETGASLAKELGIHEATVSRIRLHKSWKNFSSPWTGLGAR
jgi:hypothetical protein